MLGSKKAARLRRILLSLVGTAPDVHLLRLGDQLLAELRMGDGNQALGPLPSGLALGVELAVLRHYIVEVGAGGGDHGPLQQRGPDTGLQLAAFFVHVGGGAADEALAALGQVRAHDEVLLAAGTGDMGFASGGTV